MLTNSTGKAETLKETFSLCPVCLSKVPARVLEYDDSVYLSKKCHGSWETLIWRNISGYTYRELMKFSEVDNLSKPLNINSKNNQDCPFSCGLCEEHMQTTCLPVVEVTNRCNLKCRFCYADSGNDSYEIPLSSIRKMFQTVFINTQYPHPVQISGGEPTYRKDLPLILKIARNFGIRHVELNTNGIALGKSQSLVRKLKESGLDLVYLSLDSLNRKYIENICNRDVLTLKLNAIENCERLGIDVILVVRAIFGLNDHQLIDIIEFGMENNHVIKGVHILPVTFTGRIPGEPKNSDRITLPDIINKIESQTNKKIRINNFIPSVFSGGYEGGISVCPSVFCSAISLVHLGGNGKIKPLSYFNIKSGEVKIGKRTLELLGECKGDDMNDNSKMLDDSLKKCCSSMNGGCGCGVGNSSDSAGDYTSKNTFRLSVMAFQDVWTLDLDRLKRCCIHVSMPNGTLIPFCAYNVVSIGGQKLYR